MKASWKAGILGVLLAVAGCSPSMPSKGSYHTINISLVYFDLKDTESGGGSNRDLSLVLEKRGAYISQCRVAVVTPGKDWSKIRVVNGEKEGVSGWIDTEKLKGNDPRALNPKAD